MAVITMPCGVSFTRPSATDGCRIDVTFAREDCGWFMLRSPIWRSPEPYTELRAVAQVLTHLFPEHFGTPEQDILCRVLSGGDRAIPAARDASESDDPAVAALADAFTSLRTQCLHARDLCRAKHVLSQASAKAEDVVWAKEVIAAAVEGAAA